MTALKFDDPVINERIQEWTSDKYNDATRREIAELVEKGDTKELSDRFYRTLAFGTGGLRGVLGAGTNRMNAYIVQRATQGLANYVKAHAERQGPLRAAVAHDSRHRSREFAETVASVFAANGFQVYISPELRPTPYLSYAIRKLECHTGVMVTASHNPKEYNGYKVYWDDGSQVVPPHDKGIIAEVGKVTDDEKVSFMKFDEGVAKGMIRIMGAEMDEAYLEAIKEQQYDETLIRQHGPKLVYTPLHGVGGTMAIRAFHDWGFSDVIPEPEQMKPNGDFPTAKSPNPEEAVALERAIKLGREEGADLVLATDPDADRLGIAVKHDGEFRLITGNQLCAMLCEHILKHGKATGRLPEKPGVVTTIVTSPLVQKIALANGAECPLSLTGFKWIAREIRKWEAQPDGATFVYGTEESYGYLIGRHCRDKDGIVACCVVAEMAALAKSKGNTLVDMLLDMYQRYGVHYEWQKSIVMPGQEGAKRIEGILDGVRDNPPKEVAGRKVVRFVRTDIGESYEDGKTTKLDLPPSDVFIFDLEDGSRAIVRPSGTEPKIKFYMFLRDEAPCADRKEVESKLKKFESQSAEFQRDFLEAIGAGG